MGRKLYAFTDAFDASVTLATDLSVASAQRVPIQMFTGSKQVFDLITRGKRPTEKCLAIDATASSAEKRINDLT